MSTVTVWYRGTAPCGTPALGADENWTPGSSKELSPELAEGLQVDAPDSLFVSTDPTADLGVAPPDAEPAPSPTPSEAPTPPPTPDRPVAAPPVEETT